MADYARENLERLMAAQGLSTGELAQRTGLDQRTIRGLLRGTSEARPRTLKILAQGLGVAVDEFFVDPSRLLYRRFDSQTNPMVDEVVESHPDLFVGWEEAHFANLRSRVGTGGPLTEEDALAAAEKINLLRELTAQLALIVETGDGPIVKPIFDAILRKHVITRL